ncbi:MAG: hypothetical protein RLO81_20410 [Fulvivirga sp.]|uniref:nSTAND3 domain-containing NTPase n=1 Tax=Fulvivirga sp. TaxID=1931237 RepID=UPI0032EF4C95
MSKVQNIAGRLIEINDAIFQELCDAFLILRNHNYRAFSRSGSVPNKQKTRKGTPDSFLLLPNGRYLFMEATTIENKLVDKLLEDIKKCFDTKKTGIEADKIEEIVLCYNSDLSTQQTEKLNSLILENNRYTILSLFSLSSLSTEISLHHRNLAWEYLGLPLDTGQIISLEQFVRNYDKSAQRIATPLNNEFKHRKEELKVSMESLEQNDLMILSGPPGVGKTRFAIELIEVFLKDNDDYIAYAIANKDADLLEDLNQYITGKNKVILFIDDVNRFDRFSQVVGFFQYAASDLKIVMTVRDYALRDILELVGSLRMKVISLEKFQDKEIKEIIESEPFNVTNNRYHNKIFEIADGNPRFAIMAALLAIKEQRIEALYNSSDLFNQYFSTFIQDKDAFKDDDILKVLGIISFFYTIPYNDQNIVNDILEKFSLSRNKFINAIDQLNKLELIELRFDHVRIAEQNLGTFFFYKIFIKEKLLPFGLLLENYFFSMAQRFQDTIIPANNTFGYENVLERVKDDLKDYWVSVPKSEENAFLFLNNFWFYLPEETLSYLHDNIEELPFSGIDKYSTRYENNDFTYNKNKYIEIFGEFMRSGQHLKEVLDLSFCYVSKLPQYLPELIQKIDVRFSIDYEDEENGFSRHNILINFIEENLPKNNSIIHCSFIAISKRLLQFKYQHSRPARGRAISIYRYPVQSNEETKKLRKRIWSLISILFPKYPEECFETLMHHQRQHLDFNRTIFESDLKFLVFIIQQNLDQNSVKHCQYIHELISWSTKQGLTMPEFADWNHEFSSKKYEWLKKSDWNRLRGKEDYEFEDWKDFTHLKERDIRESLIFDGVDLFKEFLDLICEVREWELFNNKEGLYDTLDIILDETFCKTPELGFSFIEIVINDLRLKQFYPYRTIRNLAKSDDHHNRFWEHLETYGARDLWKIEFLSRLPKELISKDQLDRLYQTYDQLSEGYYLSFKPLEKFKFLDKNVYDKLLRKVLEKSVKEDFNFSFGHNFFKEVAHQIEDTSLLKEVYLYQQGKGYNSHSHYDYDGSELKVLLSRDPDFFIDYVKDILDDDGKFPSYRDHRELSAVWVLPNYSDLLDQTFDIVKRKRRLHLIGDDFMNVFFKDIGEDKEKAEKYLLDFVHKNYMDVKKMSALIDIVFHSMNHLFNNMLNAYMSKKPSIDSFKKINWLPNEGVLTGDVNWGDRSAARWTGIKNSLDEMNLGASIIPFRKYVTDQIAKAKKSGDWERKRKFINPEW